MIDRMALLMAKVDYLIDLNVQVLTKLGFYNEVEECGNRYDTAVLELESKPVEDTALADIDLDGYGFGIALQAQIKAWLAYKMKRGQSYKERGLKALLSRIQSEVDATGENVVVAKIKLSIESKWDGICWETNTWFKSEIEDMFEKTFELSPNTEYKKAAKTYYMALFRNIKDIDKAKRYGRIIYMAFKRKCAVWEEQGTEVRFIPTFENWLKKEVPEYK